MMRALHEKDVCELSENDLQDELNEHLTGTVLALVVKNDQLKSLVPIDGQTRLFGDHLDFGDNADMYSAPLPQPRQNDDDVSVEDGQSQLVKNHTDAHGQSEGSESDDVSDDTSGEESSTRDGTDETPHFPRNKSQRFHFETNSYDTLVTLFPKAGYFQRGPPFMDMTRIVRPGGKIVAVTGLQPEERPDHDAKWWVPASDDAELEVIRILRYRDFKTPILVSVLTVTSSEERHPDATVVTGESQS